MPDDVGAVLGRKIPDALFERRLCSRAGRRGWRSSRPTRSACDWGRSIVHPPSRATLPAMRSMAASCDARSAACADRMARSANRIATPSMREGDRGIAALENRDVRRPADDHEKREHGNRAGTRGGDKLKAVPMFTGHARSYRAGKRRGQVPAILPPMRQSHVVTTASPGLRVPARGEHSPCATRDGEPRTRRRRRAFGGGLRVRRLASARHRSGRRRLQPVPEPPARAGRARD